MSHYESFDTWWETNKLKYGEYNISKQQFLGFPYHNGLEGPTLWLQKIQPKDVSLGDIIVYRVDNHQIMIMHRVIAIEQIDDPYYFRVLGDGNAYVDPVQANFPKETNLTELTSENQIRIALVMMEKENKKVIFDLVHQDLIIGRVNLAINFNGLLNYLPGPYRCYLHLGRQCRESCFETLA